MEENVRVDGRLTMDRWFAYGVAHEELTQNKTKRRRLDRDSMIVLRGVKMWGRVKPSAKKRE